MRKTTVIFATAAVLMVFGLHESATAADFWHGGHRPQRAQQQVYRQGHRYGQYSNRAANYSYGDNSRRGYSADYETRQYAPAPRRGQDNAHGFYSQRGYGGSRGHHGHSAVHFDIGPIHFGLGR